jgi:hypothetical protein
MPFEVDYDDWEYTFIKWKPGMGQPVHQDYNIKDLGDYPGAKSIEIDRYWMPLTDWDNGHVFLIEDEIITNYKKGDVFKYNDPMAWHTGGNMGHTLRLTCNLTTWKVIY